MTESDNPFSILSTRAIYENPWIAVTEHRIGKPRGGEGIYGIVHFKNRAVGVVPYESGDIWLVGQYRLPLNAYSWEIPEGGALEGTESLEACALRELEEEAGLVAEHLHELCSVHVSNSVTDEEAHIFLATGLRAGKLAPDDTEELALRRIPLSEAYALVRKREITDCMSVLAIQSLMLLSYEGKLAAF